MVAAILSGGENTRFPSLKGFIEVGGQSIIETTLATLRSVCDEVVISTNEPEKYFHLGAPIIGDVVAPSCPMAGIYSVLKCTGAQDVLVAACDMPFINADLIRYIISNKGGDATVPSFNGLLEPLLAVYSAGAAETMLKRLQSGRRRLSGMLKEVNTKYVDEETVRGIDPDGRSFININTPEDLDRVLEGST